MNSEGLDVQRAGHDVPVELLEISRSREVKLVAKEDPDATENSSSFADTSSENENGNGLSDAEAESQFFGENDLAPPFGGLSSLIPTRKKKLTAHWRNFIHPLMWRCKWTEIRIKQLELQASKYARYIDVYDRMKHMASDQVTVEQSASRSVPFTYQGHKKRPMNRIKRKRAEDSTDFSSYMANHIIFGAREYKRLNLDGVPSKEDLGGSDQNGAGDEDFGMNDDCDFPEVNDNLLEHVLRKIDLVQNRVHKLKAQIDTMMINNSCRFSSSENLSQIVAGELQASSVCSPTLSACNGETVSIGDLYDLGDFIMTDSSSCAVSSFPIPPDIIESTVGLLSSIDVTQLHQHPQMGDSSEKILDNIGIHNETVEVAEGSTFINNFLNNNQSVAAVAEKTTEDAGNSVVKEEEGDNAIHLIKIEKPEAAADQERTKVTVVAVASQEEERAVVMKSSGSSSCLLGGAPELHFPKNKRKRGERKAGGSAIWRRQIPPDS